MWDELLYGWAPQSLLNMGSAPSLGLPLPEWADQETWDRAQQEAQALLSGGAARGYNQGVLRTLSAAQQSGNLLPLVNAIAAQYTEGSTPFGNQDLSRGIVNAGIIGSGIGSALTNLGGAAAGSASSGLPAGTVIGPNGLPTGTAAAAGGGVGTLSGAVPAVGASPGIGAAAAANGILDSSGSVIPGTEVAGGGGMFDNLLSGGLGSFLSNWGPLIGGLLGAVDANNQPDSLTVNQGGTSSSTYGQTLPEQITGPAGQALSQLQGLFGQGYNVAGADPATTAAIARLQNLGTNPFATGGPTNTAPTTSSFASGAGINPYLDQVFNAAADSTQNRLATEFANAGGFGSGSHGQARSQELQNLAAGIYAPGYEAERSRQYGAQESGVDRLLAQMEANLGRQYGAIEGNLGRDLSSVYPMLTGGDYLRNIQQQQNDASYTNLARYLSGLQGVMPFFPGTQTQNTQQTGSVTQPLFSNPLAGFLGGAQLGSLFGG